MIINSHSSVSPVCRSFAGKHTRSISKYYSRIQCGYLVLAIYCLIAIPIKAVANTDNLPDIGSAASSLISLEEEKRLGTEFMRSVQQSLKIIDDPLSTEYIQALGHKLVSQIDTQGQSFNFFIIDNPDINAFAGPGGHIGVHTGLINATTSESELASVIAHEIAHVVQRHLVRQFESGRNFSIATMGALIAAILLGKNNPEISEAVLASTVAGNIQQQLSFSRANEQEADRVGIDMLVTANFNPHGMADFFETLQKANRFNQTGAPEFILTHPVTESRIADTRGRARQLSGGQQKPVTQLNYKLFVARLNHLSRDTHEQPESLDKQLVKLPVPHTSDFAGRYNQILIMQDAGKRKQALNSIAGLIADDSLRIPYLITQAEIEITEKNIDAALEVLARALMLYPQNRPLSTLYATTLLDVGQPKNAMRVLQPFVRQKNIIDPYMYKLYAKSAKKAGYLSEAFEAIADYHQALGQTHTAIQHLKKAMSQKDTDTYRKLRLEARIEVLKKELINNQPSDEKGIHKPDQ